LSRERRPANSAYKNAVVPACAGTTIQDDGGQRSKHYDFGIILDPLKGTVHSNIGLDKEKKKFILLLKYDPFNKFWKTEAKDIANFNEPFSSSNVQNAPNAQPEFR
jgi:hypothetical protein